MKISILCLAVILTLQSMMAQVKRSIKPPTSKEMFNRAMCDELGGYAQIRRLQNLLARGADVNATCDDISVGDTLLMKAAFDHDASAVSLLLEHGARLEAEDSQGETALMFIAHDGSLEGAEETLKKLLTWGKGADINQRDRHGNTALMIAAQKELSQIVAVFLAHGAKVNLQNRQGQTALMLGACDATVVDALLKSGANPALKDVDGVRAVDYGKRGAHKTLQSSSLCFSDRQEEQATPNVRKLWDAASAGRLEEVNFWLRQGVDIEWQASGKTSLVMAVENGRLDVVAALLKAGANVNRRDEEEFGPSILSIAEEALSKVERASGTAQSDSEKNETKPSFYAYQRIVQLLEEAGAKR